MCATTDREIKETSRHHRNTVVSNKQPRSGVATGTGEEEDSTKSDREAVNLSYVIEQMTEWVSSKCGLLYLA